MGKRGTIYIYWELSLRNPENIILECETWCFGSRGAATTRPTIHGPCYNSPEAPGLGRVKKQAANNRRSLKIIWDIPILFSNFISRSHWTRATIVARGDPLMAYHPSEQKTCPSHGEAPSPVPGVEPNKGSGLGTSLDLEPMAGPR